MSEAPLKKCVYCKGKVERLIGAGAGLIFKGSGFYITDYKNKTANNRPQTKQEHQTPGHQAPENKSQKTEDGKQKTDGGGSKTESKVPPAGGGSASGGKKKE